MNDLKLPKLFLIISLIIGTTLIFLVPAFNSPDEDSHFQYAYQISRGNLFPKEKGKISGFDVPISISKSILKTKSITNDRDNKYTYTEMYYDQYLTQNYSTKQFSNAVVQSTPKIVYIVPVLGIELASLIKMSGNGELVSTFVMVQFARFFSLLIYSIIGYFAIKLTPKFKKSFFAILLMPVAMFLRSMVTYDGILLVIVALTLAALLKLIDGNSKFNKKYMILFIITGFILLNVKMVYSIVFLGAFAIPKEAFGSKKEKVKAIIEVIVGILILSIIQRIPYMFIHSAGDANIKPQMDFIKSHPLGYLKILAKNIIGQRRIQEYWMLGTVGYLDTYMPVLYIYLLKIYLFFIFTTDVLYEKILLPIWLKIGYFLLIIFDICGMYTLMYLSWTPKVTGVFGGSEITGVQGRYYLPFLFLIPIIFNTKLLDKIKNKKLMLKMKDIIDNNFHYVTVTSLIILCVIVFMRYYC